MPVVTLSALFLLPLACSRELAGERTPLVTRPLPLAHPSSTAIAAAGSENNAFTPIGAAPVHTGSVVSTASVVSARQSGSGVAVVELFTSEGCSSCPPADRVLAKLTARAKAEALPVYTLSFHVDYWNYLGWRDRFSSASYSERQHGYSGIGANGGTYTPQAVVNGGSECVGSDASRLGALVDLALQRPPRTQIELSARRDAQGVQLDYRVGGSTSGRVLQLALLEPGAESQVEKGENAGERLVHVNVVRQLISRPLSAGLAGHWALPGAQFAGQNLRIVAFAEDATQRDISGASAVELP